MTDEQEVKKLIAPNKSANNPLRSYKLSQEKRDQESGGQPHARMNVRPDITSSLPSDISFYQALIPGTNAFVCLGSTISTFEQFKTIKIKIGRLGEVELTKDDFYIAGTGSQI